MGTKTIKKVPMPENNEYNNNNVRIYFSDNFNFIEYEKLLEPFEQPIYEG